jgi:hypothetical protein
MIPMQYGRSKRFAMIIQILSAFAFSILAIVQIYHTNGNYAFLYFAGQHFMAGMFVSQAVLSIWWKGVPLSVEFCQNGVTIGGIRFTPWTEFKRYRLSLHGSISLVKRSETITLHIQPDQVPEVEQLLQKYIGPKQV